MKFKKGQTMPLAILSALAVLIVGLLSVNFLFPEITTFRAEMGCASAATLSDGAKILCLVGDGVIPYVILSILILAIGAITVRMKL